METDNLCVSGYIHGCEKTFRFHIPQTIGQIISYYLVKYFIYGVGYNQNGAMGFGNKHRVQHWTQLLHIEHLVKDINDCYINTKNIMLITSNKQIYVAGDNTLGMLGINDQQQTEILSFTKLSTNICIEPKLISSLSIKHSFIYTMNNKLYANGSNLAGNLGNGKSVRGKCQSLVEIDTKFLNKDEHIIDIKCRNHRSAFLTDHGNVYFCGNNPYGQCAVHYPNPILVPILCKPVNDECIVKIAMGVQHTMLLDTKHQVHLFGINYVGQFGLPTANSNIKYKPMLHKWFIKRNIKIVDIGCQKITSLFIDDKGNGYTAGSNSCGNCGNGNISKKVKEIYKLKLGKGISIVATSCGRDHMALLINDNNLVTFGDNSRLQCSTLNKEKIITLPYVVSKKDELGILEKSVITKVVAMYQSTIIFVDPYRIVKRCS
eukprot:333768_1